MFWTRWWIGVVIWAMLPAWVVLGQEQGVGGRMERLSSEIVSLRAGVSPQQQETIREYIRGWVDILNNGNDLEIIEARERLMDPFWSGPGEAFRPVYAETLNKAILPVMEGGRDLVRLNVMVVSNASSHRSALGMVLRGLKDGNPAVRYWAGKIIYSLGVSGRWVQEDERVILPELSGAIGGEKTAAVQGQMFKGLGALTLVEARQELMGALARRLGNIGGEGGEKGKGGLSDMVAMEEMLGKMARQVLPNPLPEGPEREVLRQSSRILYLLMWKSAKLLEEEKLTDKTEIREHEMVLEHGASWILWTFEKVDDQTKVSLSLKSAVQAKRWGDVVKMLGDVNKQLRRPAFGFGDAQLTVQ